MSSTPSSLHVPHFIISPSLDKLAELGGSFVVGIDEAGRGPVLGPMVYSLALWPESENDRLGGKDSKFDDSKQLSESDRESLFSLIENESSIGFVICEISASLISSQMLRKPPISLNALAHEATVQMINKIIDRGIKIKSIYVDTVGDADFYQKKLSNIFKSCENIVVTPKADSLYKVVSAASICAKVSRDRLLRDWIFKEEKGNVTITPLGNCSGYPGDEATKQWLVKNIDSVFGFPDIVRFSWKTSKVLLGEEEDQPSQSSTTSTQEKPKAALTKQVISVDWGIQEEDDPDASNSDEFANGAQDGYVYKKRKRQVSLFAMIDMKSEKSQKTKCGTFFHSKGMNLSDKLLL